MEATSLSCLDLQISTMNVRQCIHKPAVVYVIDTSVIGLIVRFYHLSSLFKGVFCCVEKHSHLVLIKLCLEFAN